MIYNIINIRIRSNNRKLDSIRLFFFFFEGGSIRLDCIKSDKILIVYNIWYVA